MIWRIAFAAWLTLCLAVLGTQPRAQFNGCQAGFCAPAAVSSGFSGPASFGANLKGWWKADAGVFSDANGTIPQTTNGGAVINWSDQSGNGFNLIGSLNGQGVGANPTLATTGLNGKAAITFARASPSFYVNNAGGGVFNNFDWGSAAPTFSIWAVFNYTASLAANAIVVSWRGAGSTFGATDGIQFAGFGSTTGVGPQWNGNNQTSDKTVANSTNIALSQTFDGTTLTSYIGNAGAVPHTWAVALSQTGAQFKGLYVGNRSDGLGTGQNFDGVMSEIVILNKSANSTDRSNMQTYLCTTRGYGC
jgi:hypothetical protein